MEGIYFNFGSALQRGVTLANGGTAFELLAKQGSMEIMRVHINARDMIWLSCAADSNVMEFFYLVSGALSIRLPEKAVELGTGDSFYLQDLKRDVPVLAGADTELLYATNSPMFDSAQAFECHLKQLLLQINEKDHYTYRHSGNVMHYARALYIYFRDECGAVTLDDLMVAALFHDVGKCYVPDEILKKKGRLEPEEARLMLRHARDSAKLLRPHFGERVAEIAANHHERLDGSGYPYGYKAVDISFAARLLAAADVFDAMTTDRGYNQVKDDLTAAEELYNLPSQYDRRITGRLLQLVREGTLVKPEGDTV